MTARLHLLGEFRLQIDGSPFAVPHASRRLLAVLAVTHRDRPTDRGALAELLRPDSTSGRALSGLRSLLWRLPRAHGGKALVLGSSTDVWLNPDLGVDLWEAEELAAVVCAGDPPALTSLPDLSRLAQDLLPGWDETWLTVPQESHRQARLHALERGAELLCAAGRHSEALQAALAAVRSEPLRETAHRRVIEVHLAEGNPAEALRQYDAYRAVLARELGLRPGEGVRRLVAPLLGRPIDRRGDAPGGRRSGSRR